MGPDPSTRIRLHVPVAVVLERRQITRRFWSVPSWSLTGVLVDALAGHADAEPLRETQRGREFAWSGHRVTLYKDACERYWHALIGDRPQVYVVCRACPTSEAADSPGIAPVIVSIDYDEAIAFVETDELVLSMEIPGELYRTMESFVLEHYRPKPFQKRRRKQWASEQGGRDADVPDGAQGSHGSHGAVPAVPPPPGDADMPPLETLHGQSDLSAFFSEGVTPSLRKAALRRVFSAPRFNVRDGLNDYDGDYTRFEPLGDIVTADMKFHTARKKRLERERAEAEALLDDEPLDDGSIALQEPDPPREPVDVDGAGEGEGDGEQPVPSDDDTDIEEQRPT